MNKRIPALLLSAALAALPGCGAAAGARDPMRGVQPQGRRSDADLTGPGASAAAEFAVRLFQASAEAGKSALTRPTAGFFPGGRERERGNFP